MGRLKFHPHPDLHSFEQNLGEAAMAHPCKIQGRLTAAERVAYKTLVLALRAVSA